MPVMKKMKLEFWVDDENNPRECKITLTVSGKSYGVKKIHVLTTKYSDVDTIVDRALETTYAKMDAWDIKLLEEDWKERNKGAGTSHLDVPVPKAYRGRVEAIRVAS